MQGRPFEAAAGRVNGPQVEIRRTYKGLPATGHIYGEAMGTNWLTSQQKIQEGHPHFVNDGWNKVRIVAKRAADPDLGERSAGRGHRQ